MIVKATVSTVKMAALCAALAVYWRPVDVATAVGIAPPTGGFKVVHEHGARFILTLTSYSWALSSSSAWYYTIMALILAQTICWASFLAEESIFGGSMGGLIDRQTEKEYAQLGAVAAFGLILFIVLFGGRAGAKDHYRRRLLAFYSKHNPDKIADIGKILKKYEGNEELLFARLQRKYSVLSHTAVENKVDEIGEDGDDEADANEQEFVEEVEYIAPLKTGDSEEDDTLEIIKPRVKSPASKPPSHPASPTAKPVGTGALRTPSPPRSPSISKSETVRSAIEDARRAQAERVQQRVAQLEARSSGRKK